MYVDAKHAGIPHIHLQDEIGNETICFSHSPRYLRIQGALELCVLHKAVEMF